MALRRSDPFPQDATTCQWLNLPEALTHFATYSGQTQSQQHIKPLHWYVACRLVLEGGFHPDDITPHPPFDVLKRAGKSILRFNPNVATGNERTVLGGLKTKNVDVVVTIDGLGPVMAVSCKGMTGAFRNLTNRMEETIGECTNLHITYPAMVFGYLFVIRANRATSASPLTPSGPEASSRTRGQNDIAILSGNRPVESIVRFHSALRELTGRRGIRNDVSRYEAVALAMVQSDGAECGNLLPDFPAESSSLRLESFFQTLYQRYEERFLLGAPDLKSQTRRIEWAQESLALSGDLLDGRTHPECDFEFRCAQE